LEDLPARRIASAATTMARKKRLRLYIVGEEIEVVIVKESFSWMMCNVIKVDYDEN
jgi:hypothetical protein